MDALPAPFAWIEIPGKGYSISKYLITNAQFGKFMDAGGYSERKWWTEAGWQQRERNGWSKPRHWTDRKWNGKEQPIVGVSWFEAVAFCGWLSEIADGNVMLPTEEQWQYTAQGDDGREYPWGNEWDCTRCNNRVPPCGRHVTTPVREYEGKGESPFGALDMAGNVWEWCLTDFDNRTNDVNSRANNRLLRGGSWFYGSADHFTTHFRYSHYPEGSYPAIGFRVALV